MEKYCEVKDGCLVVHVPIELDHHHAEKVRTEADKLIKECRIKELIFDFSQTQFMDSSGIGVIIGRCKNVGYYGGKVSARNLSGRVEKIFTVSGLHKLIEAESSKEG